MQGLALHDQTMIILFSRFKVSHFFELIRLEKYLGQKISSHAWSNAGINLTGYHPVKSPEVPGGEGGCGNWSN